MQNENNKNETLKESKTSPWLDWAVKLQAIAQAGLTYGKDVYDRERYEELRRSVCIQAFQRKKLSIFFAVRQDTRHQS